MTLAVLDRAPSAEAFTVHALKLVRFCPPRPGEAFPPQLLGPHGEDFGYEQTAIKRDTLDETADVAAAGFIQESTRIIDVGCAHAARCYEFAQRGWRMTAVDIVDRLPQIGPMNESLRAANRPEIDFVLCDVLDLGTKAARGEIARDHQIGLMKQVIHFNPDIHGQNPFMPFSQVIADGGMIVVSFCSEAKLQSRDRTKIFPKGTMPSVQDPQVPSLFHHHFSEVWHAANDAGFTVKQVYRNSKVIGFVAQKRAGLGS